MCNDSGCLKEHIDPADLWYRCTICKGGDYKLSPVNRYGFTMMPAVPPIPPLDPPQPLNLPDLGDLHSPMTLTRYTINLYPLCQDNIFKLLHAFI